MDLEKPPLHFVRDVTDVQRACRAMAHCKSPISNTGLGLSRNSFTPGDVVTVVANTGPNAQALVLTIADAQGNLVLDRYGDRDDAR